MKGLRKEGLVFFESWVEVSFFAFFALGFVLGKLLLDLMGSYLIIAAAGLIIGRLIYLRRENDPVPYYGIGAAFLTGFLLGHRVGAGIALLIIFAAAAFLSYRAHKAFYFLA